MKSFSKRRSALKKKVKVKKESDKKIILKEKTKFIYDTLNHKSKDHYLNFEKSDPKMRNCLWKDYTEIGGKRNDQAEIKKAFTD